MGPFSSDSKTSARTTNQQQTVSDQGIAISNRHSGNSKVTTKVGKGGSLTINQGIGADEFNSALSALGASLSANSNAPVVVPGNSGFENAVMNALEERTNATTERAVDEIRTGSPSTVNRWVWIGVGIVVLFALTVLFNKRKKS